MPSLHRECYHTLLFYFSPTIIFHIPLVKTTFHCPKGRSYIAGAVPRGGLTLQERIYYKDLADLRFFSFILYFLYKVYYYDRHGGSFFSEFPKN